MWRIIFYLMLMSMGAARGFLQVTPILDEAGYTIVRIGQVEVVNETTTILHIIQPQEILEVVEELKKEIKNTNMTEKKFLLNEIEALEAKIRTIRPQKGGRYRRGLVNVAGRTYNWLFGLMDDEDRQEILGYLEVQKENDHNIIETVNKQIAINNHFNDSIDLIRKTINEDREKIKKFVKGMNEQNKNIYEHILFNDFINKLRYVESRVNDIQHNIAAAKYNMVHPGILTKEEIDRFQIDFYKLKMAKMGVLAYKNQSLVIAIKIPRSYVITDLKMITPLPNKKKLQIKAENEYLITINETNLSYKKGIALKDLQRSKNCIFENDCFFEINNKTKILNIDDDTILIANAYKTILKQNCDNRNIVLKNNFLITFTNCKIELNNEIFENNKVEFAEKFHYPVKMLNQSYGQQLKFKLIERKNIENIKEIKELKYHKNVSYGINVTIAMCLLLGLIVIFVYWKRKNIEVKIVNKRNYNEGGIMLMETNPKQNVIVNERTQESSNSNGGGVMWNGPAPTHENNKKKTSIF